MPKLRRSRYSNPAAQGITEHDVHQTLLTDEVDWPRNRYLHAHDSGGL